MKRSRFTEEQVIQILKEAVHRLHRAEVLAVRRRRRKRVASVQRTPLEAPSASNQEWSMDLMSDTLGTGCVFRSLNIVDDFPRECPAIEVDTSLPVLRVIRVLKRLPAERGLPRRIVVANGPEFGNRVVDQWVYDHGVEKNGGQVTFAKASLWRRTPFFGRNIEVAGCDPR